jgi:hypothetical protein
MAETVLELIQPARQPSEQCPRLPIEHCGGAYQKAKKSTMSSKVINGRFTQETRDLTK